MQMQCSDAAKLHLQLIANHARHGRTGSIDAILEGNDHVVYVVDHALVFRFLKRPGEVDARPARFLAELQHQFPSPLPLIEIHRDEATGISYEINRYIPGVSFSPERAKTFASEHRQTIARQLGQVLSRIHAFSVDRARQLGLDEQNPSDFGDYLESNPNAWPKVERLVYPYISTSERRWVEVLFARYIALIREQPFETRVIHGDMWTHHIIVDPIEPSLAGVIDFWGRIGDPANDFKAFEHYGSDFVQEVMRHYALPVDPFFEARRLFYTGHDEVFELARAVERGDTVHIGVRQASLSAYVVRHPHE